MVEAGELLPFIRRLHERIRDAVLEACEHAAMEELARVAREEEGDTIYAVDRISEDPLLEFLEQEMAPAAALVLIAEGLSGGQIVLPRGTPDSEAAWRIIVDPIDGTRGLMYQKRSAWVLTGVAPNRGPQTSLLDIELAVQTEIPLLKQHLSDACWAVRGKGVEAVRIDRLSGRAGLSIYSPPGRAASLTASLRWPAFSQGRSRSWPPSTRRSLGRPWGRSNWARRTVLRTSTSRLAASFTS